MKLTRILSILLALSLLVAVAPTAQAGPPPGTWVSGIACQNLGTESTNVSLVFYQENNGTPVFTYNDPNPVPGGGSRNYYTPSSFPGLGSGFVGSVVVSASQPMACNINTETTGTGTAASPYRKSTSAGFDSTQVAPKMYAPQVMKTLAGTWNSYMAIQNTTATNVNVTVTYKDKFGAAVPAATQNINIPGYSNRVLYQNDNGGLPNNFVGAATIASDNNTTPLAVTVNFYNSAATSSEAQMQSYSGFSAGANKLLVPRIVRNFYGYNGGMSIQNIGPDAITIRITFTFFGNTYTYNSPSIASGAALPLYMPNVTELNGVDSLPVNQRYGNAVIQVMSGTGPIIAIVNEDNRDNTQPIERRGQGSTYNAAPDGSQTTTVFFSQITRKAGGIFSGGFQVANTTSTATTCNIVFNSDPDANQNSVPLPANGSLARFAPDVPNLNDGYNASVTVTCGQPIVGIANMAAGVGTGKVGDSATTGNGLNR